MRETKRIILVTGTDTAVGKTVVTAVSLRYLREAGAAAIALKPFSSGGRHDAKVLWRILGKTLPLERINPWHFEAPVAPAIAAERAGARVTLRETLAFMQQMSREADVMLVEGAGGLLSPLGWEFSALDLIQRLGCEVLVAAANRLGVINHTLLAVEALRQRNVQSIKIVLSAPEPGKRDRSAKYNAEALKERLPGIPVIPLPWLTKEEAEGKIVTPRTERFGRALLV